MLSRHMFTALALGLFIPSQVFWLWQVRTLGKRFIRNPSVRRCLGWLGMGIYVGLLASICSCQELFPSLPT